MLSETQERPRDSWQRIRGTHILVEGSEHMKALSLVRAGNKIRSLWLQHSESSRLRGWKYEGAKLHQPLKDMLKIITSIHMDNLNQSWMLGLSSDYNKRKFRAAVLKNNVNLYSGCSDLVLLWNMLCGKLPRYILSKFYRLQHSSEITLILCYWCRHSSHYSFLWFIFFFSKCILSPTCKRSLVMLAILRIVSLEFSVKSTLSVTLIASLLEIHTDSFW